MIDKIRQPTNILVRQAHVGASIGMALHFSGGIAPKDRFKGADTARYAAKAA